MTLESANTPENDSDRFVIINADDLGASTGINRGIIECHSQGVVTSASLMVTGRAVREAVSLSRDFPSLSIGLHFDVWGEDERSFDLDDLSAVRAEFHLQLDQFHSFMKRLPTHIDSHRHVHRLKHLMPHFRKWVAPLGVPLRDDGAVGFVGGFYAQWEWQVTNLEYVSPSFLQRLLQDEAMPGWTEFSCHPGYVSQDFSSVYLAERETELQTLKDPRILQTVEDLGLRLVNYTEYGAWKAKCSR
jgi:predicted glycoside hydrolase/deacetylase ChbG (UPF0249 family)